ncbi:protein TolR [Rhizosaccharibacter radicis]|uniref:Protein TolR n=1 Tax=Rhizosaccharibacter radicis TaxID=2782605 RepID=A0ABT1VVN7_9PROT|nr:protein TolR [Acetobacteraceae bacterium KSS12]
MQLGGGGKGRGRYRPMADINVTPLVDVMLVLLIIFMVTAPLMTSGVNVDLPKTDASPVNADNKPITVSIKQDGSLYLGDDVVTNEQLVAKLQAMSNNDPNHRIFVRGDQHIDYGRVMQVMGTITSGGFTHVALLAEAPPGGSAGAAPAR